MRWRRLLTAVLCASAACGTGSSHHAERTGPLTGLGLTPRSYRGNDLPDFLALVHGNADLLMHAGPWSELTQPQSVFHVVSALAAQQGLGAVLVLSPSSAGRLLQPLDDATRAGYTSRCAPTLASINPNTWAWATK
jgi:hypothetical protein